MKGLRRHHLLQWAVIICSLLLPLTAVAGPTLPNPGSSGCGMVACHCPCCQPGSQPQCHKSSPSPCGCTSLPGLYASQFTPEVEGGTPYQPVALNPAPKLFILAIYHPPKNSLSSL
jgi:hypothetical protein